MGEKSEQKRKYILECARKVFAERGYAAVTMKDIVEACGISRGGLYLYYESTKELFLDILNTETGDEEAHTDNLREDAAATEVLMLFLKEQKKEMFRKKGNLSRAEYEFFLANKLPNKENPMKRQFDEAVFILKALLNAGVKSGEFYCEDTDLAARNIMYVLEGLKITAKTTGISEERVDRELLYILQGLVVEEE